MSDKLPEGLSIQALERLIREREGWRSGTLTLGGRWHLFPPGSSVSRFKKGFDSESDAWEHIKIKDIEWLSLLDSLPLIIALDCMRACNLNVESMKLTDSVKQNVLRATLERTYAR